MEQANYMANQQRQPYHDPNSNTYNARWRNHPNLGWGRNQNPRHNNFQNRPPYPPFQKPTFQPPPFPQPNSLPPQPQPQPKPPQPNSFEAALEKLTLTTARFVQTTNNFIEEARANFRNQESTMRNLETQVGQIAKQLSTKLPNAFPSDTEMAEKGKIVARQPPTRTRGSSSRRQPSQEAARYETPTQAERGELVVERKSHLSNHNEKNMRKVFMRGRKIPCHLREIEDVLHLPKFEGKSELQRTGEKYDKNELDMNEVMQVIGREGTTWPAVPGRLDNNLLNKDTWMWMKLAVSNIMPTRHETTLEIDHILLIHALMTGMSVSLAGVMIASMNKDPVKTKNQLLPFPMFITKWAAPNEVPTYPGDEFFKVPKGQQFFPFGKWKTGSEVERNLAPPAPAPIPPHEQLMLLLHPDLDISQLQQISSPEVSEQQQQATSNSDDIDSSDEDGSDEESSVE
ncbi:hypothetical protein PIB30_086325 [Stylosanthes scabra]|uniref:Putative plant transposon protein domain-containing protein n=1 Tax=Stylosanthes scabra TaxID=79078 RepID=A0ABU6TVA6_9FABA|nr:hypothetical protein [Stylosanthes scabra]